MVQLDLKAIETEPIVDIHNLDCTTPNVNKPAVMKEWIIFINFQTCGKNEAPGASLMNVFRKGNTLW